MVRSYLKAPARLKHRVVCVGGQWLPELKQLAGGADDWQLPGDKPLRIAWSQVCVPNPCSREASHDLHSSMHHTQRRGMPMAVSALTTSSMVDT